VNIYWLVIMGTVTIVGDTIINKRVMAPDFMEVLT
jgi:hypothetical protein